MHSHCKTYGWTTPEGVCGSYVRVHTCFASACTSKIQFNTATRETATNKRVLTNIALFSATVSVTGDTMYCSYMTTVDYRNTDICLKAFMSQPKAPTPLKSQKMFSIVDQTAVNHIVMLISFVGPSKAHMYRKV